MTLGFIITLDSLQNLEIALFAQPQPRTMTCAELVAEGPGDNNHVQLTGYSALIDAAVVLVRNRDDSKGNIYVPVVPSYDPSVRTPSPSEARVILRFDRVTDAEVRQLVSTSVTGVVGIKGNAAEAGTLLWQRGFKVNECWVLRAGWKPWTTTEAALLFATGVLVFAVGALLLSQTLFLLGDDVPVFDRRYKGRVLCLVCLGAVCLLTAALWIALGRVFVLESNNVAPLGWLLLIDIGAACTLLGLAPLVVKPDEDPKGEEAVANGGD
jgi:hypothetical protein